jgi:MFS family permease
VLQALRAVASLLLGGGVLVMGNGLTGITLPIRLDLAGIHADIAGLVMSAYYAGFIAGSFYGQRIIARVGHIRAFAAFAGLVAASTLIYPLWFHPAPWAVLRAVNGFCMAALFANIESWLNLRTPSAARGRILSCYMVTTYIGTGAGQLLVNAWGVRGVELFCLAAMLISLSLVPVTLTHVEGPELGHPRPLGLHRLFRLSPLGVVGAGGAGLLSGAFYSLGPIFGASAGLDVFQVSIFMGVMVFGGLALQWPIGRLSDRFDRRTVLAVMLLATGLVCLVEYGWSVRFGGVVPLMLLVGLFGGAVSTVYPLAVAHAFDWIARDRMVAASSGMLLAWAAGATIGPILASLLMQWLGDAALFLFLALVALALAGFTFYRMQRRAALPSHEQARFVPLPTAAGVSGRLDPRAGPVAGSSAA